MSPHRWYPPADAQVSVPRENMRFLARVGVGILLVLLLAAPTLPMGQQRTTEAQEPAAVSEARIAGWRAGFAEGSEQACTGPSLTSPLAAR